jgi:TolB-like protein/Tfp pilus assembly protein PilF
MLAVLPFENLTGDPGQEYFSDGLTEEMITELGRLNPEHLGVIGRTSVMLYKRNPKSLDQVGRELGVQYLIEGSVRRHSDHVRITAQLIQAKNQTQVWARQYDRELKNLLIVQAEIAQEIADELELTFGDGHKVTGAGHPAARNATTSYEAYDLYLRGRYFWNKRTAAGLRQAVEYFQQAIAKDPNYARAYAGLADAYGVMSTWTFRPQNELMPKARTAALKALELDGTLAEAHTSLALIAEAYDYDWETAEKEFRRAIQLDPDYATAHQWYAEYLSWQGRFQEALAESESARRLDPLSLIIATDHGAVYYYARQYDRAIAMARAVLEMDPNFPRAPGLLFNAYVQEGRFAEALDILEHGPADTPSTWAGKAYLYRHWGRTLDAQHALAKFEQFAPKLRSDQVSVRVIAYVGTERKDQVIALLEKGVAEHSFNPAAIKVEPTYDPLRSEPQFQGLLRRLRLAP